MNKGKHKSNVVIFDPYLKIIKIKFKIPKRITPNSVNIPHSKFNIVGKNIITRIINKIVNIIHLLR